MKQTVDQGIFEFCVIEVENHIFLGVVLLQVENPSRLFKRSKRSNKLKSLS